MQARTQPQDIQLIADRYLIQERVDHEGPVELYYALDRLLQRLVLVQIVAPGENDPDLVGRFVRHQRTASALHNCGVLEVYDAGTWEGRPFSVMERDGGMAVVDAHRRPGEPPDLDAALRLTRQAAESLQCIRDGGLIDWAFSHKAVRLSSTGDACLLLIEGLEYTQGTEARYVSSAQRDDPRALVGLLRVLLTGSADPEATVSSVALLPGPIVDLFGRMSTERQDSFRSAGEVAHAVARMEASFSQPTSAVLVVAGAAAPYADARVAPDSAVEGSSVPGLVARAAPVPGEVPVEYQHTATAPYHVATASAAPLAATAPHPVRPAAPRPQRQPAAQASRRSPAPWLLAGGLVLLVLGSLLIWAALGRSTPATAQQPGQAAATPRAATLSPALATVPDLRGRSLADAQQIVQAAELGLTTGGPTNDATIPAGAIAQQDPPAGTQIQAGSPITVSLSLGPEAQQPQVQQEPQQPAAAPAPKSEPAPAPAPSKDKGKKKGKGGH